MSADAQGQLQAVVDYFNKSSSNTGLPEIDWKKMENSVHTKGVVEKIHAMYDDFMKQEYNVEAAASLIGTRSDKMKELEFINTYNYKLWLVHYMVHLKQIETLRNIGDVEELSTLEWLHLNSGVESVGNEDWEIGNLSPSSEIEHGVFTRINTQFSWGTRYNPPFVHSSDAINSIIATMAKLGK